MTTWHLLTGEYPPDCGGVGDYTAALAEALSREGDSVHVWTPSVVTSSSDTGVSVHTLPDHFGAATRGVLETAFTTSPGTVLLQYVPNTLGAKGANLAFCRWFARLRERFSDVRVMFHEPYFYFTWAKPWIPTNGLALVQRIMARRLLDGGARVYFSTETWRRYLRAPRGAQVLPIPSTVPAAGTTETIARAREIATAGDTRAPLVGHFGTYGAHVAGEIEAMLPALVERVPVVRVALLGSGGAEFAARLSRVAPAVACRAWAPGRLDAAAVAAALRACDLLVQPYPDGVTTRRTSVMAGLENGVATVSTAGALTEPVWQETGAAALPPAGDVQAFVSEVERLLGDEGARRALAVRGASTYHARFSMACTIATLRGEPGP